MNLKMPDLSTTGSPIMVVRWLVAVGDFVERGQAVLEVETDKATMEVEALNSGILLQQLVPAGDEAYAGQVLAILEDGAQSAASMSGNQPGEGLAEYDRDFLLSLYKRMLLIRRFEDRVKALFLEGVMPGTIHQCQGQEATAVGVCAALRENDFITSTFRGHGHALAKGLTVQEMLDELFGAVTGCCQGKGGSMHVGNVAKGMIPGIAIVAGGIPVAAGMALAFKMRKTEQVVACFFGDGAVAEGAFHEALNMAALWNLPVLFVCENNLYGASTRIDQVMKNTRISGRAGSYGFRGETVDGNDVVAVYEAAVRATEDCRSGHGPVLLELLTYRRTGHSRRDPCHYQPKGERTAWFANDPIVRFAEALLAGGNADQADLDKIQEKIDHEIESAVEKAKSAPQPVLNDLLTSVYASEEDARILEKQNRNMKRQGIAEALRDAIAEEMERDEAVFCIGEDIAVPGGWGGAFTVTLGLEKRFPDRMINTPIAELGFFGIAVGAAMMGMRPIADVQYGDFLFLASDQIINNAAKMRYMSGGRCQVPLVMRAPVGATGRGSQHAQNMERYFTGVPGLKVVAISNAYDAKGILKSAVRDNDPVLIFEHKLLYGSKGARVESGAIDATSEIPDYEYLVPLDRAAVRRPGSDVTILSWLLMLHFSLDAAQQLNGEGLDAEVIDLRSLAPLDFETIGDSVRKTGRVVIVEEGPKTGGVSAEIAAGIQERFSAYLKAPVIRVASPDVPVPFSPVLEDAYRPSVKQIAQAVREIAAGRSH